jgi:hypothetical protein
MALYPKWHSLNTRVVGWMHETVRREDYGHLAIEEIKDFCDYLFTPACQDREFGLEWLPFGVDLAMFQGDVDDLRPHGATFVGLLYPKRQEALKRMQLSGLRMGKVEVRGIDGVLPRETARLYSHELRSMKILLNLPSLCDHLVTKIFEGMACGATVVTPRSLHSAGKENYQVFQHGVDLLYYEDSPKECLDELTANDERRRQIAREGQRYVRQRFDNKICCKRLLEA